MAARTNALNGHYGSIQSAIRIGRTKRLNFGDLQCFVGISAVRHDCCSINLKASAFGHNRAGKGLKTLGAFDVVA